MAGVLNDTTTTVNKLMPSKISNGVFFSVFLSFFLFFFLFFLENEVYNKFDAAIFTL